MKTVIFDRNEEILKEYNFLIPLSKGDYINFEGAYFTIGFIVFNIDNNQLEIILEE